MEYLYEKYSAAVYGVVLRIVKSEDTAEEVLQDCLLRVWHKINDYDKNKGKLFTWMINIARNLAIDKIRSKEYKSQLKSNDIDVNVSLVDKSYEERFKPEYIGVRDMLDNLNNDQRSLIDLMYFKGYSQSEISEEFGIPLGTVKTRVRSAMEKLRKLFVN
jgi:RNA polymerase sigma-70 factor (ECF subfamily)